MPAAERAASSGRPGRQPDSPTSAASPLAGSPHARWLTRRRVRLDGGALLGLGVAVAGILLGLLFEGGRLAQVLQPTAGLIVFCGTLGAVAVQFPVRAVRRAAGAAGQLLQRPASTRTAQVAELLRLAVKVRRSGLVSLDADLKGVADLFTRGCLTLAVDGVPPREIEEVMALDSERREEEDEQAARVWEAAGSFAPTMGILGAVLGLIQVMQRLDDLHEVGRGIAVAFVATLYGVGAANLLLLPIAGRLRAQALAQRRSREMVLDAVVHLAQGASPRALRERLGAQTGTAPGTGVTEIAGR